MRSPLAWCEEHDEFNDECGACVISDAIAQAERAATIAALKRAEELIQGAKHLCDDSTDTAYFDGLRDAKNMITREREKIEKGEA